MWLTWHVWRLLHHPPRRHPIYQQIVNERGLHLSERLKTIGGVLLMLLLAGALLISITLFIVLITVLPVLLLVLFLLTEGIFYGGFWAVSTASLLARLRQRRQFDLLRVSPAGEMGTQMLVCAGCVHRGDTLRQTAFVIRNMALLSVVGGGLSIAFSMLTSLSMTSGRLYPSELPLLPDMILVGVFGVLLYLDHAQSVVIGCLVGMLIPYATQSALDVRVASGMVYLLIQAGLLLFTLIMLILLIVLARAITPDDFSARVMVALSMIPVFYLSREAVIGVLMRGLLWRSATPVTEWEALRRWWRDDPGV